VRHSKLAIHCTACTTTSSCTAACDVEKAERSSVSDSNVSFLGGEHGKSGTHQPSLPVRQAAKVQLPGGERGVGGRHNLQRISRASDHAPAAFSWTSTPRHTAYGRLWVLSGSNNGCSAAQAMGQPEILVCQASARSWCDVITAEAGALCPHILEVAHAVCAASNRRSSSQERCSVVRNPGDEGHLQCSQQ
jgi:hypothetical protein